MDAETSRDALSLDPELLQLPEVSPLALKENRNLAEQLYSQWLSLPDTVRLSGQGSTRHHSVNDKCTLLNWNDIGEVVAIGSISAMDPKSTLHRREGRRIFRY